jgi:NADPH2:quinone reductase
MNQTANSIFDNRYTMTQHRRVQITEFGETPEEAIELFGIIEDWEGPDKAKLKSTDVIINVRSSSVLWVDMLMTSGQYQHMPAPPYTPGLEYSGDVAWVGAGVDKDIAVVGDRILVEGLKVGPRSSGDYQGYGGFATAAVAPQDAIIQIPEHFSYAQACNLLGNYETAYHCLIARGQLQAGETVLIHGASGATGMAAIQIAKIVGATVIATGRSDEKLAIAKQYGADHTINITPAKGEQGVARFRGDVKALTGGIGAQVVYDGVGGPISLESLRCLEFGARYLIVGWAATPNVSKGKGGRGAPNANMLPTNLIQMKGLDVLGCPMIIATNHRPAIREKRLRDIMQWVKEGKITPYISHHFSLDQFKEAMLARWNGDVTGGCVLDID